jgi:hypothetical protein
LFRYDTAGPQAWAGLRWGSNYKVAYLGFGLEGVGNSMAGVSRFEILERVFAWFDEVEPQDLRRNDEIRSVSPLDRSLSEVFADLRSSNPYLAGIQPGTEDTEPNVLTDGTRPLVLYELADPRKILFLTATRNDTIAISWR